MITFKVFLKLSVAFGLLFFLSCKSKLSIEPELLTDKQLQTLIEEGKLSSIKLPDNAIIEKKGENAYSVQLPDNYRFVFETEQGLTFDPISTITCTCSEGSGCSPVRAFDRIACVMQPSCRTCQLSGGRYGNSKGGKFLGIVHSDGYFNFITTRKIDKNDFFDGFLEIEEKDVLSQAQEWLFEWDSAKRALMDAYNFLYQGNVPEFILQGSTEIPSDYVYVKAALMGNAFALPIPKEMVVEGMMVMDPISGEIKCKCLTGQSGCNKIIRPGGIVVCKSDNCVSCQMQF